MNANDRKKLVKELSYEVDLYNNHCVYLKTFSTADSSMWISADNRRSKSLHRLKGMIDIANICDNRYIYRLEYNDYGMYSPIRLYVEKVEG